MNKKSILTWIARIGYGARGIVYLIIGWLAARGAIQGGGGSNTGSKEAIMKVDNLPGGDALLVVLGAGLAAYSIWRFFQAVLDTDDHGVDFKGLAIRGSLLVSALTHLALAVFAFRMIGAGGGGGGGGKSSSSLSAQLMQEPWGRWAVALIGLCIVGAGIAHAVKGFRKGYQKHMTFGEDVGSWADPVCRFGLTARGVVFVIIGFFFGYAAWTFDPEKARGLSGALASLENQPYGTILLLVVAVGLFAFGVYSILEMFYRRILAEQG